ncbi:hypothetical protein [Marinobacter salarius]|uniref:Uncharacterized protein n=1 Tax=Marinobacter salarius TaxID=1420917 RepID=A0A1W6KFK9_9GAMM|nr:hypothetical protein [Marinobacter salarius]ARM86208.1 hypothetical protein MARSALSMR5_04188 [Marinobacter salarius]
MKPEQTEDRRIKETDESETQGSASTPETTPMTKGLRTIAKWSARTAAVDVLYKDARRIKPRFPQLWRDIRNFRPGNVKGEPLARIQIRKTKLAAVLCTLLAVVLALYFGAMFLAATQVQNPNVVAIAVTGVIALASAFVSICYWSVLSLQKASLEKNAASKQSRQGNNNHRGKRDA